MSSVLKPVETKRGMSFEYARSVALTGKRVFKEEWRLESERDEQGTNALYRVSVKSPEGRWEPRSDFLCLMDFVLFWDGFRLCAAAMRE